MAATSEVFSLPVSQSAKGTQWQGDDTHKVPPYALPRLQLLSNGVLQSKLSKQTRKVRRLELEECCRFGLVAASLANGMLD